MNYPIKFTVIPKNYFGGWWALALSVGDTYNVF